MIGRATTTRVLQIGLLLLLVVSAAQVLWWYVDQELYSDEVRERLLSDWARDVAIAARLLASGERPEGIEAHYPHLVVRGGTIEIDPRAVADLDAQRARRLHRYLWEGGFFLVVLAASMVVLWKALLEEARLRRRQENFLAAVSHEFKSPLASLQLTAETLKLRPPTPERLQELVGRLLDDLQRMGDMVAKVLDVSALEHGRVQLHAESVSLSAVVTQVLERFEEGARRTNVRLASDVPPALEVHADPVAARVVVRNLVDNALKAVAAAGGGTVSVRARREDGYVRLEVVDDGLGFRREEAQHLFEKFYRPGDEMRRRSPGTGLGLYIVRRFMQLQRGRYEAHSDGPGKGAVFAVSWPVEKGTTP